MLPIQEMGLYLKHEATACQIFSLSFIRKENMLITPPCCLHMYVLLTFTLLDQF
jgi:hypothetical protein